VKRLLQDLREANQPNPEQQQATSKAMQMEMAQKQATIETSKLRLLKIVSRVQQNKLKHSCFLKTAKLNVLPQ
jgi:hypothetical protein